MQHEGECTEFVLLKSHYTVHWYEFLTRHLGVFQTRVFLLEKQPSQSTNAEYLKYGQFGQSESCWCGNTAFFLSCHKVNGQVLESW
jgi:hypothetical protein